MNEYRYSTTKKSPFFEIMHGLNKENLSDFKVGMLREVDMSAIERMRASAKIESGQAPSYTAFVVKAVSLALKTHPEANRVPIGFMRRRVIQLHDIDMTVAVERDKPGSEQEAFAATIRGTDQLTLSEITRELQLLARATPETHERLRKFEKICLALPSRLALLLLSIPRWIPRKWIEHRGGAVLISSPAKYGTDIMVGAWPWPLGFSFGFVKPRPVVVDDKVVARTTMWMTFSFDRRLMAGAPSARFFNYVCHCLTDAEAMLSNGPVPRTGKDDNVMATSARASIQDGSKSPALEIA